MKNLLKIVFSIIFPEKCSGCGLREKNPLCENCKLYISSQKVKTVYIDNIKVVYFFSYSDPRIKKIIWSLKYKNNSFLRKELIHILSHLLSDIFSQETVGIPIPKNKKDSKQRDFDHAWLLGQEISKNIHKFELVSTLLKTKSNSRQVEQNTRQKRMQAIQGTMSLDKKSSLFNKSICIIDDVTTTGSTLKEANRVIQKQNPKNIMCLVLAH